MNQEYERTGVTWDGLEKYRLIARFRMLARHMKRSPLSMLYQLNGFFGHPPATAAEFEYSHGERGPTLRRGCPPPPPVDNCQGGYMCFVNGGATPTMIHAGLTEAKIEAKRLCLKTSKRVIVLQLLGDYSPPAPLVPQWTPAGEAP